MVSVIVPHRNSGEWLPRCIASLEKLNKGFEIILVNDGDEEVRNDRFMILHNEHSQGVSGARNTGLDHAHGDWITFLDADDEIIPYDFEPCSDIVQYNHLRRYRSGKIAQKYTNTSGWYTVRELPLVWCMVWNKVYSRDLIKDIRFNESLQYGEDELFNLECFARCKKFYHDNESTVIHCFDNKGSLSHIKGETDIWKHTRALEQFLIEHEDPDIRRLVCGVLSEHWGSPTYAKIFYGG